MVHKKNKMRRGGEAKASTSVPPGTTPATEEESVSKILWLKEYHQMSRKELLEDQRSRAAHLYPYLFSLLDPRLKDFFDTHHTTTTTRTTHFPAVDLAAGEAISTLLFALRYRKSQQFSATLDWYPTEYTGTTVTTSTTTTTNNNVVVSCNPLEDIMRESLRTMAQQGNQDNFLFVDKNGSNVFKRDVIRLEGFVEDDDDRGNYKFNGIKGIIQHQDPFDETYYGIKIESQDVLISVKQEHIISTRRTTTSTTSTSSTTTSNNNTSNSSSLSSSSSSNSKNTFFDQLIERSCEIDLLQHETWNHLQQIHNTCALVTCLYLLTSIGKNVPTIWQDTLQIASKLLCVGGYLLQYDTMKYGGYGETNAMKEYVANQNLKLELEHFSEPIPDSSSGGSGGRYGRIVLLLWKKVD